jgi:aerobic-type carbon monoxide dehydrogenase small subunit (CoxS/CutS family)
MAQISFTLNGKPTTIDADENRPLLWVLRDDLGLTGTKFGCGQAVCGSCTVVVGTSAMRACAVPIGSVQGERVTTIEGLAANGRLHPVQEAFVDQAAFQCGYCTPGMIMGVYAALLRNPASSVEDVMTDMEDHLCRCGAHVRIVQAVAQAAQTMRGQA